MKSKHVVALVIGCLLALPGIAMLVGGIALGGIYSVGRDDAGYFSTTQRLQTDTVAVTIEDVLLDVEPVAQPWINERLGVDVRVRVTPTDPQQEIFVGIAPGDDVDAYLQGTAHDQITRVTRGVPRYERASGGDEVAPPTNQDFWTVQDTGTGTREVTWELAAGDWALVIMNADGSPGVAVSANLAAHAEFLLPLAWALAGIGLVFVLVAAGLIAYAMSGRREVPPGAGPPQAVTPDMTGAAGQPPTTAGPAAPALMSPGTPVMMTAHLDPALSRGLWIVKWLLAIPHFIILGFLWAAFAVVTILAWFAILFSGSYPRALFDFNVGVLRWSWRVSYYCGTGGLGSDRYPAFSLEQQPEDLATLDVAYPARLSRGLIFVKWLLALPHLLITGLLVGNGWTWRTEFGDTGWETNWGSIGILGLLVLIAALVLLFSGEYPKGLFDLVIGLNRWVYRVAAYVALMTDQYPPFRLDSGETERPAGTPPPGPSGPTMTGAEPAESMPVGTAPPGQAPTGSASAGPPPAGPPPAGSPPAGSPPAGPAPGSAPPPHGVPADLPPPRDDH